MKYKIELDQTELSNLKVFLSRSTLQGNEVLQFMRLVDKINTAEVIKDE